MVEPRTKELLDAAKVAETREEAVRLSGEAVANELLEVMKSSGIAKADASVRAMRLAGLDRLLAAGIAAGGVTYGMVHREIERFRAALAERKLSANDIKLGILAFDESAQRLALAAGKSGSFQYASTANRARDSLITFARSLHR